MKKTVSLLLVISMLLTALVGIGLTASAVQDSRMLNVKYQFPSSLTSSSESTAVRLFAAVDELDKYSKVGWCYSFTNSKPTKDENYCYTSESTKVYTSLIANKKTMTVKDIYSGASWANYIFFFEISGIPKSDFNTNFYVRSYVVLKDGSIEYGAVSTINVQKYLNSQITYNSDNSGWTSRWY
ncbi:MAG: hypothetical protein IKV36_00935 [Clostridia bacterium]|nr:hypothetical protein [Clostridia bacterium]